MTSSKCLPLSLRGTLPEPFFEWPAPSIGPLQRYAPSESHNLEALFHALAPKGASDGPVAPLDMLREMFDSGLPPQELDMGLVHVANNRKLTDVLSGSIGFGRHGWVVSRKVRQILEPLHVEQSRFYPITVVHKRERHDDYSYFRYACDATPYIDFARSSFGRVNDRVAYLSEPDDALVEPLEIASLDAYEAHTRALTSRLEAIVARSVCLSSSFPGYDLFQLRPIFAEHFVSARLQARFQQEGVTGVNLKEMTRIHRSASEAAPRR